MIPQSPFRKIFQDVATRRQMFHLFDRHGQAPMSKERMTGRLYDGEWFEIGKVEHDYMFEILPPLWMRSDMFAMREFMAGSITSIFFTLAIHGRIRHFHGYCDQLIQGSAERLRDVIIDRESQPMLAMTRAEQLDQIWSTTPADYRGYAGDGWPSQDRGKPTVLAYVPGEGTVLMLLDKLLDHQIAAKLDVHLRRQPEAMSA